AKGESLPSILDGICRLVEEISRGSLCSILLLDPNGDRLWYGAAPSLAASFTSAFDGGVIGPQTGPCGRATYFKKQVVVADIAAERRRAEEALHRSEAYLAQAQQLSLTGSFGWNVCTGEIIWSKETYCILGYDRAMKPSLELVLQRVHPEDRTLVQRMIDRGA